MQISRENLAENLVRRFNELKGVKVNFEQQYQEIIDYMMPYRQAIYDANAPGQKTMGRIHDSSPIHSHFLFAAGLHGMITNPSTKWFSLTLHDDNMAKVQEVKWWLWETENRMFKIINQPGTQFNTQANEGYLDYGGFGMFCMFMGEDPVTTCYFNTLNLAQIVAGEDSRGRIDTVLRRYPLNARQVLQEWPNAPEKVRKDASEKPEKPYDILHAVYPRKEYNSSNRTASQMPWGSTYVLIDTKDLLSEKGFNEFPYLVPRFSVAQGEVYGRGPGMIALPDTKQLNQMEQDIMRAAQKKIDPPVLMVKDSFVGPIRFTPSGVSYVRGTSASDKMAAFPMPGDLGYGEQKEEQKRQAIGNIFYNNMLQLVEKDRMTAAEVYQRTEEKLRLMGPMLGRLQSEFLEPLIGRLFGIMLRQGLLPSPPRIMRGHELHVQFVSPLAKAQRVTEAQGIMRTLEMMLPAANIKPEILDVLDWDKTIRHIADVNSVPAVLVFPEAVVAQKRAAKAKLIQQQQQMEQLQALSKSVGQVAPAMQNAGEAGSPIDGLMNMLKGAGGGEPGAGAPGPVGNV
jgi:hypothetical protein